MAKQKKKKSISLILRNYFITGVVVLIPIGFTLYLSKILIGISSKVIPENIKGLGVHILLRKDRHQLVEDSCQCCLRLHAN